MAHDLNVTNTGDKGKMEKSIKRNGDGKICQPCDPIVRDYPWPPCPVCMLVGSTRINLHAMLPQHEQAGGSEHGASSGLASPEVVASRDFDGEVTEEAIALNRYTTG